MIDNFEDEGFTDPNYHTIYVNIEYLWDKCNRVEAKFITEFSDVLTHEKIHCLIHDILGKKYRTHYGEEKMVRLLLGEPFSKTEKITYKKFGRVE